MTTVDVELTTSELRRRKQSQLTPEQEARIIFEASLVERWRPFACKKAWGYYAGNGCQGEINDYVQAAILGMVIAAGRFNPDNGNDFSCYAGWYITAELQKITKQECARGVHIPGLESNQFRTVGVNFSAMRPPSGDGDLWERHVPQREGDADGDSSHDADAFWEEASKKLTLRQKQVVRMRVMEEMTLSAVGERLGLSKERVRQVQREAMEKIAANKDNLEKYLETV